MTEFNGHESWNAWNVSLWIANDERLYRMAVDALKTTTTVRQAADRFFALSRLQNEQTPDGAYYSARSVRLALAGLEIEQPTKAQNSARLERAINRLRD